MVQVDLECGHSYRRPGLVPDEAERAFPGTVVERECRDCNPPTLRKIINVTVSGSRS